MHKFFYENLPNSLHDNFNSLAEPKRTKSYKLEWVLFKTLKYFPSALFPNLLNSLELELKETKSAKLFKRKIFKNYLDSYDSNNICYPVPTLTLSIHPFPYTFSPPPYLIHDLSSLFFFV